VGCAAKAKAQIQRARLGAKTKVAKTAAEANKEQEQLT